jgi:hypothetical protein
MPPPTQWLRYDVGARSSGTAENQLRKGTQNAAFAGWRILERDRIVIRYEFASRQWSGYVEPFDDRTGKFGGPRDLASDANETIKSFFELVLATGRPAG